MDFSYLCIRISNKSIHILNLLGYETVNRYQSEQRR